MCLTQSEVRRCLCPTRPCPLEPLSAIRCLNRLHLPESFVTQIWPTIPPSFTLRWDTYLHFAIGHYCSLALKCQTPVRLANYSFHLVSDHQCGQNSPVHNKLVGKYTSHKITITYILRWSSSLILPINLHSINPPALTLLIHTSKNHTAHDSQSSSFWKGRPFYSHRLGTNAHPHEHSE